ncbi:MAG: M23 family metallopeptidase [Chloroflexota bacterium]
MKRAQRGMMLLMVVFLLSFGLAACAQSTTTPKAMTVTNTITTVPASTMTATSTATATIVPATLTPSLEPTPTPTALPCSPEICIFPGHFILSRPITATDNDHIDITYRYGSTQNGLREAHHGVEFPNPEGTPVLAAAEGVVITAGNDHDDVFAEWPFFYGNLVIIEHTNDNLQAPFYTLYGHLSQVDVEIGEQVKAGGKIGLVGLSGTAIGAHLHFEVRIGENSYQETRNPELWLEPHSDENGDAYGAIIGRTINIFGGLLPVENIEIKALTPDGDGNFAIYYLSTYDNLTIKNDLKWEETFAIGGLPAGNYRVSFVARGLQYFDVQVLPGMVTMITFDASLE